MIIYGAQSTRKSRPYLSTFALPYTTCVLSRISIHLTIGHHQRYHMSSSRYPSKTSEIFCDSREVACFIILVLLHSLPRDSRVLAPRMLPRTLCSSLTKVSSLQGARALCSLRPPFPTTVPSKPIQKPKDQIDVDDLTRARAFLGYRARNTHPESTRYLLGTLAGHSIIDPEETLYALRKVLHFLKKVSFAGGSVLFVSSKPQLSRLTRVLGEQSGQFYIARKWVPGLLTNWNQTRKSVKKALAVGAVAEQTGRLRQSDVQRAIDFKGIEKMYQAPDVIVLLDSTDLQGEPAAKNVPVVGIVDTNQGNRHIDYPIPANANSIRFYHTLSYMLVRCINEGKELRSELDKCGGGVVYEKDAPTRLPEPPSERDRRGV